MSDQTMTYEQYNATFKRAIKGRQGRILMQDLTPTAIPVTLVSGSKFKIDFDYICNSPGSQVIINIFKRSRYDFSHVIIPLEFSDKPKHITRYLTCPDIIGITDGIIRIWVEQSYKRTFVFNENVKYVRGIPTIKTIIRTEKPVVINEKIVEGKLRSYPISFLTFVKNEGQFYLERLIKSLINYANELVIVDTGSTDNSFAIYEKYKHHKNLKVYSYPCSENELYKSINKGIEKIKNEWIFVLGGDEALLKEELFKIPDVLDSLKGSKKRIVRVSYLDFIGQDEKRYHTKYPCMSYRIWKNTHGFHVGGGYQCDIHFAYDDGIQTSGIKTKKHMPSAVIHEALDITYHHYARCKPPHILLEKRVKRFHNLYPEASDDKVMSMAKVCPFYTLKLPFKVHTGPRAGVEHLRVGVYTRAPSYLHFAKPIIDTLKKSGNSIKIYYEGELEKIKDIDVLWVEWGDYGWVTEVLKHTRPYKVIVRIHRYEIYRQEAKNVQWNNADILWFVSKYVMKEFQKKFPDVTTKMICIPNAVDTQQIIFRNGDGDPKNIFMYSVTFGGVKDYSLAISLFRKLSKIDNSFHLTIRADPVNTTTTYKRLLQASEGLNVDFITTPVDRTQLALKDDVNQFFDGQGILLSTSKYECFHYSIAEALSAGMQVFVRNWKREGSPEEFWNPYLCNTERDMINSIIQYAKMKPSSRKRIAKANRKYVNDRFHPSIICDKLVNELTKNDDGKPWIGAIMPVYNNTKYLDDAILTLLGQSYNNIIIFAIDDESTDETSKILNKYKDMIVIKRIKHGGPHHAMSEGLKLAKHYNIDYTVMVGSDDVYYPNYLQNMIKLAEKQSAYLVYPNFDVIDETGAVISKYTSQPPNIKTLRKVAYICDHSLTSSKFWNIYGWELRDKQFKAYSIFHVFLTLHKQFFDKVIWINENLWGYRKHDKQIHTNMKNERKGQRKLAWDDIMSR